MAKAWTFFGSSLAAASGGWFSSSDPAFAPRSDGRWHSTSITYLMHGVYEPPAVGACAAPLGHWILRRTHRDAFADANALATSASFCCECVEKSRAVRVGLVLLVGVGLVTLPGDE